MIGRGLAVGWVVLWGGLHSILVIGIGLEKGLNHWDPLIVGEEGYCEAVLFIGDDLSGLFGKR